jgi:hypothetical protein
MLVSEAANQAKHTMAKADSMPVTAVHKSYITVSFANAA